MKRNTMVRLFLTAMSSVILGACAAPKPTRHVAPEWPPAKPSILYVDMVAPEIRNPDDLQDDFGEEGAENITEWFREGLAQHLADLVGVPVEVNILPEEGYRLENKVIVKDTFAVPFHRIKSERPQESMTLVLFPVIVERYEYSTPGYYAAGVGGMPGYYVAGASYRALRFSGNFRLLNSSHREGLAFGQYMSDATFAMVLSKSDWEKNIKTLAYEILKTTPLVPPEQKKKSTQRGS